MIILFKNIDWKLTVLNVKWNNEYYHFYLRTKYFKTNIIFNVVNQKNIISKRK